MDQLQSQNLFNAYVMEMEKPLKMVLKRRPLVLVNYLGKKNQKKAYLLLLINENLSLENRYG